MHPWVYYLLDIGNGTRAIWHGRQTMVNTACESGGVRRVVFYPVEYRGAGTAYIRRAGGGWEKEHRISDYLGSQRLALKPSGMSSLNFGTFGEIGISSTRPGYIGKEKDGESQTGDYGARHYDELSGRFLSVDPLWASFPNQTPYQYGYNNPVMYRDPSGMSNEKPINGSSKGGGSHTCSRCGQPKNNNDNDSPLNPGNHICGGGTQFGSSDAYAARINSEFSALANKNSGETSGGRTMVIGGEKVESGSGGRSGKNGNKNSPAALSAKTGRGNDIAANPSNMREADRDPIDVGGSKNRIDVGGSKNRIYPDKIKVFPLPEITVDEFRLLLSYPISSTYVLYLENKAVRRSRELAATGAIGSKPLDGEHNNVVDAVRHTLYAYYLSHAGGDQFARAYLYAHERFHLNPANEMQMDLHNNELGLVLARGVRNGEISESQVENIIIEWSKSGILKTLR